MSKHRVLSFKPHLQLEWRGQDGQNETEQPDHSASLGDSTTSSTQISFSDKFFGTHRIEKATADSREEALETASDFLNRDCPSSPSWPTAASTRSMNSP